MRRVSERNWLLSPQTARYKDVIIVTIFPRVEELALKMVFRMQSGDDDDEFDADVSDNVVEAPAKPKLKKPSMYKVLLLNDDYTPMEFVVHILENFFLMSREKATQVMLAVHTTGSGVAGIYPQDIAETKSEQVNEYAKENQHPLMSKIEMTD